MSHVFVDLGAYNGDSLAAFYATSRLPVPAYMFDIYAFEPNPALQAKLKQVIRNYPNVQFSKKAAWVANGKQPFAVDGGADPLGSTLMPGKVNIWNVASKVTVETFDFSAWVKQFEQDYLIVKMDIEGAEFPILRKMIDSDTIKFIDQLWCEFHPNKVLQYTSTDNLELIKELKQNGVALKEWH